MTKADEVLDAFRDLEVGDVVDFYVFGTKRAMRGTVDIASEDPSLYIRVISEDVVYLRYRDELTYVPQ